LDGGGKEEIQSLVAGNANIRDSGDGDGEKD